MDIDLIRNEFNRIKKQGFIKSIADYEFNDRNDGAAGETFQYHLGRVARDNKKEADWEGWEVKSKRASSNSAITLFSGKPSFPEQGDKYMLKKWGIPHDTYPSKLKLNTSIYATRYSKVHIRTEGVPTYNMKIKNCRDEKKIKLIVKDIDMNLLDDIVYWSYDHIEQGFTKLKNTFLVDVEVKKINGKDHFYYTSAQVLIESNLDSFLRCIDDGFIRYDHRWDVDKKGARAGEEHNHGGGFRFDEKQVAKQGKDWKVLASKVIEIE